MEDLDTYYDDNSEDGEEEEDYPGYGSDEDQLDFSEGETGAHASAAVALDTTTCQALTPDLISKKMFEIIDEVNAVFQVSERERENQCGGDSQLRMQSL